MNWRKTVVVNVVGEVKMPVERRQTKERGQDRQAEKVRAKVLP